MEIALIEIKKPGDNKSYNAGFGTTFNLKTTPGTWILKKIRQSIEKFPTISYAYISAIFKKYNHSVKYYLNTVPNECDLAILNVTAIRNNEETGIINTIKNKKKYKIGVYGVAADALPELYKNADFIITGEPENAIEQIANTEKIPQGIIDSKSLLNLEDIPYPDYKIFDINKFSYSPLLPYKPFVFLESSRGCNYSCSYCPHRIKNNFREKPLYKVIDEIKYMQGEYGVHAIHFVDSFFNMNEEKAKDFQTEFKNGNINIKWSMETRVDTLTCEIIDRLYETGLRAIKIGIESQDNELLKKYNRIPPDINHAINIVKHCNQKGIRTNICYIIGFPGQTKNDIVKTLELAKKLNSTFANFFIFTPIPGTDFIKNNNIEIIDNNLNHRDNFHLVFKHKNFNNKKLRKIQSRFIRKYYFRISWVLKYLKLKKK